jgi:hypothetical protein
LTSLAILSIMRPDHVPFPGVLCHRRSYPIEVFPKPLAQRAEAPKDPGPSQRAVFVPALAGYTGVNHHTEGDEHG